MFHFNSYQANRKDQHVFLAKQQFTDQVAPDFAGTRFVHHSLPQLKVEDVAIATQLFGRTLANPFFINAMTGGSEATGIINRNLATLAHLAEVPMASGSVSAALKDSSLADSFKEIRRANRTGFVLANLGAHHSLENAQRAVDLLEANALQIHLNAPQEIVMPEGDRDFSMCLKNIEEIVQKIEVPVIVKEVGFGMSRETISQLVSVGVQTVDVSGTGGTNFIQIENARRVLDHYDFLADWGQSTVISLVEALSLPAQDRPQLIASGGVKNPLDIVKSLALGADLVGLSGRFLQYGQEEADLEKALAQINAFKTFIAEIMALLGAKNIAELRQTDMILAPNVQQWCQARGIDWASYANRSIGLSKK